MLINLISSLSEQVKAQKSSYKKEIIGGLTTFFTVSYIIFVNPSILATPGTGMEFNGVLTATVLLAFSMTLLMGLYAKLPFAVAPGMGINAFFTFSLILGKQIPWQIALGMVFWAGVFFLIISVTPIRIWIVQAIPENLRLASATGIGIFLTFIGLKNAGIVVANPVTFVQLGKLDLKSVVFGIGFFLIFFLHRRKNPFAFIFSILFITLCSLGMGWTHLPEKWVSWPDFHSVLGKLDFWNSLEPKYWPSIFSVMFTDLFDSISTFVGLSVACGLLNSKREPINLREGLIVDSWATMTAGIFGTSSGTAYIESASGVEAGGRTGLSSVVTAFCFLPCIFLAPVAAVVPALATAPVLVLVGALMFRSISELKLNRLEDAIPAFLILVLIPLTFSITQGILWGIVSHLACYVLAGRRKELPTSLYLIGILCLVLVWVENSHM